MKKYWYILCGLWVSACTVSPTPGSSEALLAPAGVSIPAMRQGVTRATDPNVIGIFRQGTTLGENNVKFTRNGSTWVTGERFGDASQPGLLLTTVESAFVAYYPYDETITQGVELSPGPYAPEKDVCMGKFSASSTVPSPDIALNHLYSRIKLRVVRGGAYAGSGVVQQLSLGKQPASLTYDFTTGAASGTTSGEVTLTWPKALLAVESTADETASVVGAADFLLLPGTVPADGFPIVATVGETVYNAKIASKHIANGTVTAGYYYSFDIVLGDDKLTVTPNGNVMEEEGWEIGNSTSGSIWLPDVIKLGDTADTRANCYIVHRSGSYSLNATVKGNGKVVPLPATYQGDATIIPDDNETTIDASKIASAEVLWETANTSTAPAKGAIVDNVSVSNGVVTFTTGTVEGNAVIAVKNASNLILWSWHIWCTNEVPAAVPLKEIKATDGTVLAAEGELKVMDRNLGALGNVPYTIDATAGNLAAGLLYQWGRKDPMPGWEGPGVTRAAMATTPSGIPVIPTSESSSSLMTVVRYPTTFYYGNDWCSKPNGNLWGCPVTTTVIVNNGVKDYTYNANPGTKTIYDPCPAGWRMGPGYVFANLNATSHPWTTYGRELVGLTNLSSGSFFLGAAGFWNYTAKFSNAGTSSRYYLASPAALNPPYGTAIDFESGSSSISLASVLLRATACSVRCISGT